MIKRAIEIVDKHGIGTFLASARIFLHTSYWSWNKSRLARSADTTDADSQKTIFVDPRNIIYLTGNRLWRSTPNDHKHLDHFDAFHDFSFGIVVDGSWDSGNNEFTELAEYDAIKTRFEDGYQWEETSFYQIHRNRIFEGYQSYGCDSIDDLESKLSKVDELYATIRDNGYRTSKSLGDNPLDEVTVNIGRNGQLLYEDQGRHRLSIAKILDLDKIPVLVKVRHRKWQQIREGIVSSTDMAELPMGISEVEGHPDLRDIT